MSCIRTYTGNTFDYIHPSPLSVSIDDIAHALGNICRFSGHVRQFYSVAQHSVLVSQQCRSESALWGLLHDASEAYCSDLPRPFKRVIGMEPYCTYEKRVMDVICDRFGLPREEPLDVIQADRKLLVTEQRDLMINAKPEWPNIKAGAMITPWTSEVAKRAFMSEFVKLTTNKA